MDDLEKQEEEITAELWAQIGRVDKTLMSLRNTMQHEGLGSTASMLAGVVAEQSVDLVKTAAKGEGHVNAVRKM